MSAPRMVRLVPSQAKRTGCLPLAISARLPSVCLRGHEAHPFENCSKQHKVAQPGSRLPGAAAWAPKSSTITQVRVWLLLATISVYV